MLGVRKQTPTLGVYCETGRFPLQLKFQIRAISPKNSVVRNVYDTLLDLNRQGQLNWCAKIQDILSKVDMFNNWMEQSIVDVDEKAFISEIKEKLYMSSSLKNLQSMSDDLKLRVYKFLKQTFVWKHIYWTSPVPTSLVP